MVGETELTLEVAAKEVAKNQDRYRNIGTRIGTLLRREREAAEAYEDQLRTVAQSGRLVIDRLSEDSDLLYYSPMPRIAEYPAEDWWPVLGNDRGRASRLTGVRPKNVLITIPARTQAESQPVPEIEFTHGRTSYRGNLTDIVWHILPESA